MMKKDSETSKGKHSSGSSVSSARSSKSEKKKSKKDKAVEEAADDVSAAETGKKPKKDKPKKDDSAKSLKSEKSSKKLKKEGSTKKQKSSKKVVPLYPPKSVEVVEVIAPANLPGGYEFLADVDGKPTLIRVPKDGVYQEQKFFARVVDEVPASTSSFWHNVPHGKWRDNLCDCGTNGCFHPMCCLSVWCMPLVLGQVMTRLNLDACGRFDQRLQKHKQTGTKSPYWTPFKVMAILFFLYIVLNVVANSLIATQVEDAGSLAGALVGFRVFVDLTFGLYFFAMMLFTRNYIRRRYAIRSSSRCNGCGGSCEDACCALACPFCTTTQMARHTAGYNTYNAVCCTDTGFPKRAPQVV